MKKPISYRLQEWAADRFDSAQYPPISPPRRRLFQFRHQMPLHQRAFIVLASSITILVCIGILAVLGFFGYFMFFA